MCLSLFPVSKPQTTLESMDIKGNTFEHVMQVGKGLPSIPLGTADFGDSFTASDCVRCASSSSILPMRLSFPHCFTPELPRLGAGDAFPFPLPFSDSCNNDTERVSRLGVSTLSHRDDFLRGVEELLFTSLAFWERVEMIERKVVVVDGSSEVNVCWLRVKVGDNFLPVDAVRSEGRNDVAEVKVDPATVNSISLSPGMSAASARGLVLSSSRSSLSSLLSEVGLDTAYTPRLVRRSFRFSTGFSVSLSEELDDDDASESESELSDESVSELSSSRLGAYPPLPFLSQVSHKQCLFLLPTTTR